MGKNRNKEKEREYQRRWREKNRQVATERVQRSKRTARARAKAFIEEAKRNQPCADCGATFHPVAMHFDHVRGTKFKSICALVNEGKPIAVLEAEIEKCELRCANCHAVRHFG